MQPFTRHEGLVVPLDRPNIDTDQIIPKQFLKATGRTGFGPYLFDEWRYLDRGEWGTDCGRRPLNRDFVLNQPRYRGASILLARENFGCGSSREHAPWALLDYGIRCVIAPSFADIFFSNCCKNGLPAVTLPPTAIDRLFKEVQAREGYALRVDLPQQSITLPSGEALGFEFNPDLKERLVRGLDDIAVTLEHADDIRRYEARRAREAPWLFPAG
ncbi:MAG TPA: 3-isopropylmalate dehydratase small subunit [Gammaproteobacteria bacterium]|nr:3-isopropylmalate dehydratase small subunit [Gammaproteobacteria bacterium]